MKTTILDELSALLDREIAVQERLTDLGERKRTAVVGMDLPTLREVTAQEEIAVGRARELEAARRKLVASLVPGRGGTASLGELLPDFPESHRSDLARRRERLLEAVRHTSRINRLNARLLEEAVGHLDRFARLMLGGGRTPATYGPPAHAGTGREGSGLVDRSA